MAFMRPEIRSGSYLLALGIPPEDMGIAPVLGKWYGRLSAPGFLDSTEWVEYDSEAEAMSGVCEAFGLCPKCHEEEDDCICEQAERLRKKLKRACKRQLARLRKLAREADGD